MNRERYGHHLAVHLLGVGMPLFLGWLGYRCAVDPFMAGDIAGRVMLVSGCAAFAIAVLVLYLRSGIQRYEVAEDWLIIERPWSHAVVPWEKIRRIDWNRPLHFVVLRGADSVITFTSTDYFPRIVEFLQVVHERSGCELSPHLKELVGSDGRG